MRKDISPDQKYYDPEIECMPRPELEALQLERLKDMVAYAYDNTVYYRRAFDEAGVAPSDLRMLADIAKFPFCDKKTERETQHVGSFFGEMCSVPEEEVIFMATSSGSTGVPTVSPFTQEDFDLWQDTEARPVLAGRHASERPLRARPELRAVRGRPRRHRSAAFGRARHLGGRRAVRPSAVRAQAVPAHGHLDIAVLRVASSARSPRRRASTRARTSTSTPSSWPARRAAPSRPTREAIETCGARRWWTSTGCPDIYGACAAACEAHDGLHIVEDQILVETVDPATGEVLAPGETGELVFTTLMKKARPMIRFRTGDIGYVSTDTCECGRTLTRIHVTGRKDEMFIVGAVNVFPSDVEFVVRGLEGFDGEYSIRVYEKDFTCKYEVSVERAQGSDEPYDEVAVRTEAALKAHTGVPPPRSSCMMRASWARRPSTRHPGLSTSVASRFWRLGGRQNGSTLRPAVAPNLARWRRLTYQSARSTPHPPTRGANLARRARKMRPLGRMERNRTSQRACSPLTDLDTREGILLKGNHL